MLYVVKCNFFLLFLDFKLWRLTISRPVKLRKSHIAQKKVYFEKNLEERLSWEAPDKF